MKFFHFYHIYSDGNWKSILSSHINFLRESRLIENLYPIKIGISGNFSEQVVDYLKSKKIDFEVVNINQNLWEQTTLIPLHEFSKQNDGYILYAHTKGAANSNYYSTTWRISMTYYLIHNWSQVVEKLRDFDAIGCHYIDKILKPDAKIPFFGGNFWWSHLSHIRKLDKPCIENRWEAENWILSNSAISELKILDLNPGWPTVDIFKTEW